MAKLQFLEKNISLSLCNTSISLSTEEEWSFAKIVEAFLEFLIQNAFLWQGILGWSLPATSVKFLLLILQLNNTSNCVKELDYDCEVQHWSTWIKLFARKLCKDFVFWKKKGKKKTMHDKEKLRTSTATKVKSVVNVNKPRKRIRKSKYSNSHCGKLILLASDLLYLILWSTIIKKKKSDSPPSTQCSSRQVCLSTHISSRQVSLSTH